MWRDSALRPRGDPEPGAGVPAFPLQLRWGWGGRGEVRGARHGLLRWPLSVVPRHLLSNHCRPGASQVPRSEGKKTPKSPLVGATEGGTGGDRRE